MLLSEQVPLIGKIQISIKANKLLTILADAMREKCIQLRDLLQNISTLESGKFREDTSISSESVEQFKIWNTELASFRLDKISVLSKNLKECDTLVSQLSGILSAENIKQNIKAVEKNASLVVTLLQGASDEIRQTLGDGVLQGYQDAMQVLTQELTKDAHSHPLSIDTLNFPLGRDSSMQMEEEKQKIKSPSYSRLSISTRVASPPGLKISQSFIINKKLGEDEGKCIEYLDRQLNLKSELDLEKKMAVFFQDYKYEPSSFITLKEVENFYQLEKHYKIAKNWETSLSQLIPSGYSLVRISFENLFGQLKNKHSENIGSLQEILYRMIKFWRIVILVKLTVQTNEETKYVNVEKFKNMIESEWRYCAVDQDCGDELLVFWRIILSQLKKSKIMDCKDGKLEKTKIRKVIIQKSIAGSAEYSGAMFPLENYFIKSIIDQVENVTKQLSQTNSFEKLLEKALDIINELNKKFENGKNFDYPIDQLKPCLLSMISTLNQKLSELENSDSSEESTLKDFFKIVEKNLHDEEKSVKYFLRILKMPIEKLTSKLGSGQRLTVEK